MMHVADPYAPGVLVKAIHDRLVANLDNYAEDAGIQPYWVCTTLPTEVPEPVRDYIKGFKRKAQDGVSGLVLTGKSPQFAVERHMSAIAGCFLRNFIAAKLMTLGSVIDRLAEHTMPEPTCLLIPNFYLSAGDAGTVATWQTQALHDLLTMRAVAGLQTILYVSEPLKMGKEYGMAFKSLIDNQYEHVEL